MRRARIGDYRHLLEFKQQQTTQDEYGGLVTTWVTFAQAWGSAEELSGDEYWVAQQVASSVSIRFRIRYMAGLGPLQRVIYGGKSWDIVAVLDPDGRRRELEILAKATA